MSFNNDRALIIAKAGNHIHKKKHLFINRNIYKGIPV